MCVMCMYISTQHAILVGLWFLCVGLCAIFSIHIFLIARLMWEWDGKIRKRVNHVSCVIFVVPTDCTKRICNPRVIKHNDGYFNFVVPYIVCCLRALYNTNLIRFFYLPAHETYSMGPTSTNFCLLAFLALSIRHVFTYQVLGKLLSALSCNLKGNLSLNEFYV